MAEIKAVDTVYNGYKFRSRLEARWAVFFDALGIEYQYEPEGFDLGDAGWYLPDFWLPEINIWIEIKPSSYFSYALQCDELAKQHSCNYVLQISGIPKLNEYKITVYPTTCDLFSYFKFNSDMETEDGRYCFALGRRDDREIWLINNDTAYCFNAITHDDRYPLCDSPKLLKAYDSAMQARFEHGREGN